MAASTYHSEWAHATTADPTTLCAVLADRERCDKLGAEDEDDARVVGEHGDAHERAQGSVDPVVHAHAEDVPAKELLGGFEEHGRQERPRQSRSRGDLAMGKVAVGDEEERRAEGKGEGQAE